MPLRFPAQSRKPLLITILLLALAFPIAAQNARETAPETLRRLVIEGQQLVDDGSPASLTKAVEKFEAARQLAHSLNNVAGEAALLSQVGFLYNQLGQNRKALEIYTQALPLFRITADRKGEATTLFHMGLIFSTLGEN